MAVNENIRKMSIRILYELGEVKRSDSPYDNKPVEHDCTYKGYNLEIVGIGLPAHVDPEENKKYLNDVEIKYFDDKVFDSRREKYKPGYWEDILLELHRKLPILSEEKRKKEEYKKHASDFFHSTLEDLGSCRIGNEIEIIKNSEYGDYKEPSTTSYKVFKGQSVVFYAESVYPNDYEIIQYTPGEWENQIKEYREEIERERKVSQHSEAQKTLKKLRNLK